MSTRIYACITGDNEIREIDSKSTIKDGAAYDGTGGSNMTTDRTNVLAYFRLNPIDINQEEGMAAATGILRTVHINAIHAGFTAKATPIMDEVEITGQTITEVVAPSDLPLVHYPFHAEGTKAQVDVEFTALSDVVRVGKMNIDTIPYRRHIH